MRVVQPSGRTRYPDVMGLDAADCAGIIIPQMGLGVNPASKKFLYEPEPPASGLDWHARMAGSRG